MIEISAASFRDHTLESVAVVYSWSTASHAVDISVRCRDGLLKRYRIDGVKQLNISEDFAHAEQVETCTLISKPNRVYLSLDPYEEGVESERDNYCVVGECIAYLNSADL